MKRNRHWLYAYILTAAAVIGIAIRLSRTVTVLSENASIPRKHCIILDAGHGGEDGGATSCTGISESKLNLDIALRLNDLFHLLGYNTKMIRTTDVSVYTEGETLAQKKRSDLNERVRIVNSTENALLLSIHQNQFSDNRYSGAQVFYSNLQESKMLAEDLQAAFRNTINPGSSRQCKRSKGIYLMEHTEAPGILIECGFLSNPAEEALLRTDTYQKKLCAVIAATVSQYLSNT